VEETAEEPPKSQDAMIAELLQQNQKLLEMLVKNADK
jgi:hypothetical protein